MLYLGSYLFSCPRCSSVDPSPYLRQIHSDGSAARSLSFPAISPGGLRESSNSQPETTALRPKVYNVMIRRMVFEGQ